MLDWNLFLPRLASCIFLINHLHIFVYLLKWPFDLKNVQQQSIMSQTDIIEKFKASLIPWKYFKFGIFCMGESLISKCVSFGWLQVCCWSNLLYRTNFNLQMDASAPFIGHRQTHSEIVALKGGTQCLASCFQIPMSRLGWWSAPVLSKKIWNQL